MIKCLKIMALPIGAVAVMLFGPAAGVGAFVALYFALEVIA